MESVQVGVKIEVGHKASCKKKPTNEGFTHDWLVFVRGPENCDISNFVEKVVFHLHESFAKPRRVLKEPPYQIGESGYGSFFLPIEVYFKNKEEPRKVKYNYDLCLPMLGSPPIDNIRSEALTFTNPTEEFKRKLLKGGGTVTSIGSQNGFHSVLSPVNGLGGNMDMKEGKSVSTNLTGNPNTTQLSTTAQEDDRTKKTRTEKVIANKTVKALDVTPGVKRPAGSSTEEVKNHPVKKKKKKPDEGTPKTNKNVGFIAFEPSVPGSELKDKLEEVKDIKLKIKSLSSKVGNDKKKEKHSSSNGNLLNSSKHRDLSSSAKKCKQKGAKQTKLEHKKLDKITFRRDSGDSWSSSTSSSSSSGHFTGNKNPALNVLLAEIEDGNEEEEDAEEEDDNEVDIFTPFHSSSLHSSSHPKPVTENVRSSTENAQKTDSNALMSSQPNKGKSKTSSQSKKLDTLSNGRKNGLKSPTMESSLMKSPPSKHSPKPRLKEKHGSNGQQMPSSELLQLHRQLVTLKDSKLLQRIADILESTGQFVLTDTTLDFDLCSLDRTTIRKIESSIGR